MQKSVWAWNGETEVPCYHWEGSCRSTSLSMRAVSGQRKVLTHGGYWQKRHLDEEGSRKIFKKKVTRYENFIQIRENLWNYATFFSDRGLFLWFLWVSSCGSGGKEPAWDAGDLENAGLIPGSGNSPGGGNSKSYSCLEISWTETACWVRTWLNN